MEWSADRSDKRDVKLKPMESGSIGGNRPVSVSGVVVWFEHPSSSGHVKPRVTQRGPSRKAKYYLATDSELVP